MRSSSRASKISIGSPSGSVSLTSGTIVIGPPVYSAVSSTAMGAWLLCALAEASVKATAAKATRRRSVLGQRVGTAGKACRHDAQPARKSERRPRVLGCAERSRTFSPLHSLAREQKNQAELLRRGLAHGGAWQRAGGRL